MVCLDTDVIVTFLRKDEKTVKLIEKIKEADEKISTTVINEFELWKGVYSFKKRDRETSLRQFLSNVGRYNLDSKSSQKAAEIFEYLKNKGKIVDVLDIIIASITIVNNESLLTFNKKHFENVPNIKLL